jgi:hypothetical protein
MTIMKCSYINPTRRKLLIGGARLASIIVAATVAGGSGPVAAKAAKGEFMYQNHPHNGNECGDCKFFTPNQAGSDSGICSIVEGRIQRDGWCSAFAPKPSV